MAKRTITEEEALEWKSKYEGDPEVTIESLSLDNDVSLNMMKRWLKKVDTIGVKADCDMGFRLKDFSDDEIVVLDCALHEDVGIWNDEEKDKICRALAEELTAEVESRNLIPDD